MNWKPFAPAPHLEPVFDRIPVNNLSIDRVFERALAQGGEFAELFFEQTDATRVIIEEGKVDRILDSTDGGVGMRVIFGNRFVHGYTTELSDAALFELADTLARAIQASEPRAIHGGGLNARAKKIDSIEWRAPVQREAGILNYAVQKPAREWALKQKIAAAERAEKAARAALPEAKQVTAIWIDSVRNILVMNSDGVVSPDVKHTLHMVAQVVAEKDGRIESAMESDGGFVGVDFLERTTPESIGEEAARRVKVLLSASPAPSGPMPVVMAAEAGGTMIHEAVGHGLEADLACNGLSVYQDKVGQQVASPLITVVDDGSMLERRGSYRFDDEGTPSQKTTLIENGVLKNYLVDRLSAMKFDRMATGNGRRETFRHKPIVRMTNTYIAPGKDDPEQILRDTKWGVYVKQMGGGQVNTVTGDFVFAVTEGYLIRDGKMAEPIRGATLVGNGPKVLSIVDRVGTDLGFATGTCGKDGQGAPVTDAQPTMRIPEMTVGGEVPVEAYWKD